MDARVLLLRSLFLFPNTLFLILIIVASLALLDLFLLLDALGVGTVTEGEMGRVDLGNS